MNILDKIHRDKQDKYYKLKAQMRTGVFISDDDFRFVKSIDQTINSARGRRLGFGNRDNVHHEQQFKRHRKV